MNDNNHNLMKYAGLGFQFLIGLALFLYLGLKVDRWFFSGKPLGIWIAPLFFIIAIIIKIIKDTSTKK